LSVSIFCKEESSHCDILHLLIPEANFVHEYNLNHEWKQMSISVYKQKRWATPATKTDSGTLSVPDTILDLKGLKCPLPVLKTRKALTRLTEGDQLTVLTTDPMAEIDIPHFCQENGHRLLDTERTDTGHKFLLTKGV
jgi:tRNA 2-thiouridine synthesizing protein A